MLCCEYLMFALESVLYQLCVRQSMKVTLDLDKSIEENAGGYFDKAKRAKQKIEGAREALERIQKKLIAAKKKKDKHDKIQERSAPARKRKWYEKFRWFISSEGKLVIGGRDSTTNEIIIKKHAEKDDLVFHTDMAGSPFFVVKDGKSCSEATLEEAAVATASFSKAWKEGLGTLDVFYVSPDQVSKEAEAGEHMAKGAFMIRGKTTYLKPRIGLAIGLHEGAVMCGPPCAVKKHCEEHLDVTQGKEKPSDAAKLVRKKLGGDLDEIIRALPAGGCRLA